MFKIGTIQNLTLKHSDFELHLDLNVQISSPFCMPGIYVSRIQVFAVCTILFGQTIET